MELSRETLADELDHQLRRGLGGKELASWAHRMYLSHSALAPGVYAVLMQLIAIDEGSQFALTESDLTALVEQLRSPAT